MRRIIALILILPALALAQARFGHGAMSASQMLPIITDAIGDSSKWTAGTHVHAIKPRGGKSVQADTIKAGYLNVTGDTQLDGNLTMNTVASESLKVLAGGIRNEGGLIQKGNSSFGLQQTPKSTVQITGNGISVVNYYKGLRLSNPDAATVGVQALSPALVFRGAGWKTDATAGSDSVLWAIYNLPVQGAAAPTSIIKFDAKVGAASWANKAYIASGGVIAASSGFRDINGELQLSSTSMYIKSSSGTPVFATVNQYATGSFSWLTNTTTELMRLTNTGYLGIGTTTPAALLYANNSNVLSKPLFRLGRDKNSTPDSVSFMVTGMGKVSIGPNVATAGMTPADTLNLVNILGKKSSDSLFVVHNDIVGRDSVWAILPNGNVGNNGMVTIKRAVSLADQAEYTPQIPSGMCGWGSVQIGNDVEWARFRFKTDGTVTLEANSTNVGTTNDTDTKLNIYDAGTAGIVIENQLGSTLTAAFVIECHLP